MRTWFITGAARGLGAAIAERALGSGDAVVVATMQNPAQVRAALGTHERLLVVPLDVTQEAHARAAVAAALGRFGRMDAVVNNAGYGLIGAIEEASAAEVERVFRTSVFGLLNVTRAALPQLRKQRRGQIVNVSSVGNHRTGAGWGIYGATKSAVEAISAALADEGEPFGIHTTVVESGSPRPGALSASRVISTTQRIDDYRRAVSPLRSVVPEQAADPGELADAIVALLDAADPPRRIPLSGERAHVSEARHEAAMPELESWRSLVVSADFAS